MSYITLTQHDALELIECKIKKLQATYEAKKGEIKAQRAEKTKPYKFLFWTIKPHIAGDDWDFWELIWNIGAIEEKIKKLNILKGMAKASDLININEKDWKLIN